MAKIHTDARKRFAKEMADGCALVLFAGEPPVMRGDENYKYAAQRNLVYLTGVDRPGVCFMMRKEGGAVYETLYLKRGNETRAKWVGEELSADAARQMSGVKNYGFADEMEDDLAGLIARGRVTNLWLDLENQSFTAAPSADVLFARKVREAFPGLKITDAYPIFGRLRAKKAKGEVNRIAEAIRVTGEAFLAMLANAEPGMKENELEAHIDYHFKRNGCDRAFTSIVAGGANAAVLHYNDNNRAIEDGSLVLADFGAQYEWYSADVTRTFPINGVFTERQRVLYDIVLGGNLLVISLVKPGVTLKELNDKLKAYYVKQLKRIGLIEKEGELDDYYYHGVSHPLGLETHDVGRGVGMPEELIPGMVITVEPGLYIAEEGIGIRIEDDVLVTAKGCDVLTKDLMKTADEIERFMAENRE